MGVLTESLPENSINMAFRGPHNSIIIPLPNGRGVEVKFQEKRAWLFSWNPKVKITKSQGQTPKMKNVHVPPYTILLP